MGHCIQVIAAPNDVAKRIRERLPTRPFVQARWGIRLFPVDDEFVDEFVPCEPTSGSDDQFLLLTDGFRKFLRGLSRLGPLAYLETEYFGGAGGQGAAVYGSGEEVMAPVWAESNVIDQALKRLGVPRPFLGDRFRAIGLDLYRSNDDLLEAAANDSRPNWDGPTP